MVNRQLVSYIREQLSHGAKMNEIQTLLHDEGWEQDDITAAVDRVRGGSRAHNRQHHHLNFLTTSILGVVVLILIGSLLLVVFRPSPSTPEIPPPPLPPPVQPPQQLTGWAVCANEDDASLKDTCYQSLNEDNELFDCDVITDSSERGFCYRAKEVVLLKGYA